VVERPVFNKQLTSDRPESKPAEQPAAGKASVAPDGLPDIDRLGGFKPGAGTAENTQQSVIIGILLGIIVLLLTTFVYLLLR
jgi:hypothetical protein